MRICGLDIPDLLACCIDVFRNHIREDLFRKFGGMDFPSKLCEHFAMKVCGLDVPDLCVVIFLELWLCNFFYNVGGMDFPDIVKSVYG